jgi:hypothetical protein
MNTQQKLQVEAEQKKQHDFTITQTVSFDFVINATNEDEALEKFHNLVLHPNEYFTFASDESFSRRSAEVLDSEDFEESDSESRCIIEDVKSFRNSKRY